MLELASKIGLDASLIDKLTTLTDIDADLSRLPSADDVTRLAICVKYAKKITEKEYKSKGIPDNIFIDTMHDIAVWCENNGNKGLKNYSWIEHHLKCELFKIGRLQYQMYRCDNDSLDYDCLPFDYGENLIYVHIPQGERLIYSECLKSLMNAKLFFLSYFSDFKYRYFFSESWLLYRENQLFMAADSNILQFQLLFDIVYSAPDEAQAIERIFGKKRILKSLYPENTSLQRRAKRYMKRGGKLGIGIGIIDKNDISV
ncbi:MAG: DUF5596 domain-containing protein [Eubacterium sp.]|nr:DUF5596 domain-containing protein [Eubacterium sp.]